MIVELQTSRRFVSSSIQFCVASGPQINLCTIHASLALFSCIQHYLTKSSATSATSSSIQHYLAACSMMACRTLGKNRPHTADTDSWDPAKMSLHQPLIYTELGLIQGRCYVAIPLRRVCEVRHCNYYSHPTLSRAL